MAPEDSKRGQRVMARGPRQACVAEQPPHLRVPPTRWRTPLFCAHSLRRARSRACAQRVRARVWQRVHPHGHSYDHNC
eukprot:381468-Pleurochrysis_carterae.AAC.1